MMIIYNKEAVQARHPCPSLATFARWRYQFFTVLLDV